MDIYELQRRCREIAGEADDRTQRRKARLASLPKQPPKPRVWLSDAEFYSMRAEKDFHYYAHIDDYGGSPLGSWRLKTKRK